jgi:endonuclease III related protein
MGSPEDLPRIYDLLNGHFGDLHWWPADGHFEMMVGAILTQNTSWKNVEKAIEALKDRRLLSPGALDGIDEEDLAAIIRSSGYYRLKAKRLKSLVRFFLEEYSGSIETMSAQKLPALREKLLDVWGVGPETADSILLYACKKPVFIIDAYTRRILHRHLLIRGGESDQEIGRLFMTHLPPDVALFNQFHALLVAAGKAFCRKRPECDSCPLRLLRSETGPF